jgi:hypothetical protein
MKVTEVRWSLDSADAPLTQADVVLEFSQELSMETRVETTVVRVSEDTPYRAWRELYEFPLGAASLPLATTAQALDLLALGSLPDSVVGDYMDWTVAALNPGLNAESSVRVEREEVARDKRDGHVVRTVVRHPAEEQPVELRLEGGPWQTVLTDDQGRIEADLLELARPGLAGRPGWLGVSAQEGELARIFPLDPRLTARLEQAVPWLALLDDPEATPVELAAAVAEIDQLGFARYSFEAEHEIYERLEPDAAALMAFRRTLRGIYPESAPAVSQGAVERVSVEASD